MMTLIDRLLAELKLDGLVSDIRVGQHWSAVAVETGRGLRAGLAATQVGRCPAHDVPVVEHGQPTVRDAGRLLGRPASELAGLARADSLTERSIGFASVNALLEVDEAACVERNAEDIILERGKGRRVAIVGHFPFVSRAREVAEACWVLELRPGEGDLPADRAADIIPQADLVAITGMTLVNGTFEALAGLCSPRAYVLVLGPSTPLSPILFDYGVDAISGTIVVEVPAVLAAVSQGATFRQIPGKRLVTMTRGLPKGGSLMRSGS
jgi:uncharacterized protein (DUF4213/DUF364 family)